jgi:hypothetical protein
MLAPSPIPCPLLPSSYPSSPIVSPPFASLSTPRFNLFSEVDRDSSGFVTFDEFEDVIRHLLKKGPSVLSATALKALWCALDADDSNELHKDEVR